MRRNLPNDGVRTSKNARLTPDEKAARITQIKAWNVDNWTASEMAFELKMSRSGILGFCHRNGIRLKAKNTGRRAQAEGERQRAPRWRPQQGLANKKKPRQFPLITHVVSERPPQVPPKTLPQCLWHGCTSSVFKLNKPYCATHHVKSGGLFCS